MGQVVAVEPVDADLVEPDLNTLSDDEVAVLERRIAGKYMRRVPWSAVIWGLGNVVVFLSLFPLVISGMVPLWLGFPIATLTMMLAYLPSHEAQHNIIAGRGKPLRWLNELLGHASTIPLVLPYRVLRATHMQHHAHCNDPQNDPDYRVHAGSSGEFFLQHLRNQQPGSIAASAYTDCLKRTGQTEFVVDAVVYQGVYLLVLFTMAWTGYALEAALLWWLPKQIAMFHLSYYLSWAPHHPGEGQGRYQDTRAFRSKLGNVFSMGMQYHIVHHLYPRIPLSSTPAAYRELRPILKRQGCDLGAM